MPQTSIKALMLNIIIGIFSVLLLSAHDPDHALGQAHRMPSARPKTPAESVAMWSIDKRGGAYALQKRLMSRAAVDKMLADAGPFLEIEPIKKGDKSFLLVGDGPSIIYFAGIGQFQAGRLFVREFSNSLANTSNSDPKKVPFTSSVKFGLNGLMYAISAAVSGSKDGWNMQVYLTQGRKRQLLSSYRQTSDAIAGLDWIADIDRDGRPDFLLSTAGHSAYWTTTLYLSSRAKPGTMVRAVARFAQGD